ncbi:MAG: hypothetical protein FJX52_03180 [Alphaproteobacteria bacterium]|nr:hypothetical protein [Alphaproteobacteria bacterium]
MNALPDPAIILAPIWRLAAGDPEALGQVTFEGSDPALPSVYVVGTAAAVSIAASALAAAELWRLRMGHRQKVRIDFRGARADSGHVET